MRKRIALSTVSLVLLAVGTTVAVKAGSSNGAPQLAGASPSVSATSAAPSAAPSPSSIPSQVTASGSATAVPSSSASPWNGTTLPSFPAGANPPRVIPSVWLSASELPFTDTFTWKAESSEGKILNNANLQALTVCGDPAKFIPQTIGGRDEQFFSTPPATVGNNQATVTQYVFFFDGASAAQQGYDWLRTQYTNGCSGIRNYDTELTQVGSDGSAGMAWLTRKVGTGGWVDLAPYNREYFVLRGNAITYVDMQSTVKNLRTTYDDASELSKIASHLCVYGGSCN